MICVRQSGSFLTSCNVPDSQTNYLQQHRTMVNRSPSCRHDKVSSVEQDSTIQALFSTSAVRQCCGKAQTTTEEQIQVIGVVIDSLLLSMAEEGYVQTAELSSVASILKEIRRKGHLNAAPWDNQPRLEIKCTIPKVSGASERDETSERAEADVHPSKAWADMGGAQYNFVGKLK